MANQTAPAPEYCQQIVAASVDYAMLFLDGDGVIRYWNTGAEKIFGLPAAEAIGRHHNFLFTEEDCRSGVPDAELRTAAESGKSLAARWLVRHDGTRFWGEGTTTVVRDADNRITGYAKVARNASERQRLEQALERSSDELHRFSFTVSHDLQEPLRTVRNFAELLQRRYKGKLDADADDFITFMVEAVGRMGQLLNDLTAYSRAGREDKTRPEPCQGANVLQWALMNVDGLVKQTSASITWDPLPVVYVDQNQFANLFQQLLTNSLKFRSEVAPVIHVSAHRISEQQWQFSVRDNGTGVPEDQTERIFGVFKRLVHRDVPGTGIGLAICRKIVEAHGGRIWMDSSPGQGATVHFTLPAYD
ncbi:MAG TPA: ATP-binding protein [Bryobacteraceae bacterium]|nr:ATP-binding protein [Bryobacteraceae bacterium]